MYCWSASAASLTACECTLGSGAAPDAGLMVGVLLQGLAKLQKTQKDVDVLVEEAKIKAVEVEKKVAGADAFAEQVSILNSL